MKSHKGSILLETLIALMMISFLINLCLALNQLKTQAVTLNEDYEAVTDYWKEKRRCEIYCPKKDPVVDITF